MNKANSDIKQDFCEQLVALLPRLRRFALSLTSDMNEADDLVQAACERALLRKHQWQTGTRLDSWMFKIIYHIMIDETRTSRKRKPHIPLEEEQLAVSGKNIIQRIEGKLQVEKVNQAMQKLTDNDRTIISLVCIEDMSYKDAALVLNIPVGTVMSRLARARKKLHQLVIQ